MLKTRIIPVLQLRGASLVKTERFGRFRYIGDPCNTVRIFNELEVDELVFLDITATREGRVPDFELLADIANECFMPMAYGGGITTYAQAKRILDIGFEKIILNSAAWENPDLVRQLVDQFGAQAVVVSMDVKRDLFGRPRVYTASGTRNTGMHPVAYAKHMEALQVGEILLTAIAHEGTWRGFDIPLLSSITAAIQIPVVAHGGAGSLEHVAEAVNKGGASAVALGSMVVFQKQGMGVLVNMPDLAKLEGRVP